MERNENVRIDKRVCLGEYATSHSVGIPWKRWIDIVKDWLKKRGFDVRQARRMVHNMGGSLFVAKPTHLRA